ncbi:MAG: hypothetical protein WKF59_15075 [Chitinophagaceae bacterium]
MKIVFQILYLFSKNNNYDTQTFSIIYNVTFYFISFSTINHSGRWGNKKASVSERIGITDVTIHYDRPGSKRT